MSSQSDIHLWVADRRDVAADHTTATTLLSDGECARAARFLFERDRGRYIAAHVFLRQCLSRHVQVHPAAWQFEVDAWGKPHIAAPDHEPRLHFNLTHSGEMIACVIGHSGDVGVDVEQIQPERVTPGLIARVLSVDERAHLPMPAAARALAFFEYWTLKEACAKGIGRGLAIDPRAMQFDLAGTTPRVAFTAAVGNSDDAWQFWMRRPAAEYVLSVAARGQGTALRLIQHATLTVEGRQSRVDPDS